MSARPFASELIKGAVCGALAFLALDGAILSLLSLAANVGDGQAARAMASLGFEKLRFALLVLGGTATAGALVGIAQGALRWLSSRRTSGLLRHAGWSLAIGVLWVVRQYLSQPALVGSAIPELEPFVTLAVRCGPRPVDVLLALLVVLTMVRWLRRSPRRLPGRAVAVLLLACGLSAATPAEPPPPRVRTPNVLILAADSIRPDHLSLLGYRRPTPNLDALARSGVLFDRAISPLARTTPAWVSILSGQYPHRHGVRHMFPTRSTRMATIPSLARVAAGHGYRTSVTTDYAGDFFPTFELGFADQLTPPPLNAKTVYERELIQRLPLALAFLNALPERWRPAILRYLLCNADPARLADEIIDRLDGPQPFFAVGFFSATHAPFASPYPYHARFTDRGYRGPHRFQYGVTQITDLNKLAARPADAEIAQIVALYDGALNATDDAVGRVLAALERKGLRERTLIVFLSDHGENLFEPGQTTLHGQWFRGGDEANRVPLIFSGPGVRGGGRGGETVSLVDVAPTVAALLGWDLGEVDGRPLLAAGRAHAPDRPVFAETGLPLVPTPSSTLPSLLEMLTTDPEDDGQVILEPRYEDQAVAEKHRALWYRNHKLVYEPTRTGFILQLFDLAADPRQRHPLDVNTEHGRQLEKWLLRWIRSDPMRELDLRGRVRLRRAG